MLIAFRVHCQQRVSIFVMNAHVPLNNTHTGLY